MRCENCQKADLMPAAFLYERTSEDGTRLTLEVQGFICPRCGDRVLYGRDAERVWGEWYPIQEALTGASLRAPLDTTEMGALPLLPLETTAA